MAMFGDDQGRTEKATPGKLSESRNKGDTHLSRELVTGGSLLVTAIALDAGGGWLMHALGDAMRHGLNVDLGEHPIAAGDVPGASREILQTLALIAAPVLLLMGTLFSAAVLFGYLQIGLKISNQALRFNLGRLNPASNWKKLLSPQSLVRTGLAVIKLGGLCGVMALVLQDRWMVLTRLSDLSFPVAIQVVADLAMTVLIWVAAFAFVLALFDVLWQRYDFQQRNMMTKQEVEDERKRGEGDPLIKSRLRSARMELLRNRMMQAIPNADVVITNPTHFAVALRYDRKKNRAPEVIAKGADEMAARIRELAREHDVPLMEDPPLARALFRAVKVGQEIPARFYEAVATVLSHVYRLKDRVA
ncbi:MAG: flagellar biosynthesis protein FlhB [Planctomycetota bacterium]